MLPKVEAGQMRSFLIHSVCHEWIVLSCNRGFFYSFKTLLWISPVGIDIGQHQVEKSMSCFLANQLNDEA